MVNNDEVFPDHRIRFVTSDVNTVFHNSCAKRSDTGSYTIQLVNSEGSDSATCRVSLIYIKYVYLFVLTILNKSVSIQNMQTPETE